MSRGPWTTLHPPSPPWPSYHRDPRAVRPSVEEDEQKNTCKRRQDSQSSQVRCAFWQWKHARFAFFFFGPSRVRECCEVLSALSLAAEASAVRLRLGSFFALSLALEEGEFADMEEGAPENIWCADIERPRVGWS